MYYSFFLPVFPPSLPPSFPPLPLPKVNTRAWNTPRFREMKTPEIRIAGQNPVGQRNIIPGTVEVSSTEMGSGYVV